MCIKVIQQITKEHVIKNSAAYTKRRWLGILSIDYLKRIFICPVISNIYREHIITIAET
jgi:hypothetical protein